MLEVVLADMLDLDCGFITFNLVTMVVPRFFFSTLLLTLLLLSRRTRRTRRTRRMRTRKTITTITAIVATFERRLQSTRPLLCLGVAVARLLQVRILLRVALAQPVTS